MGSSGASSQHSTFTRPRIAGGPGRRRRRLVRRCRCCCRCCCCCCCSHREREWTGHGESHALPALTPSAAVIGPMGAPGQCPAMVHRRLGQRAFLLQDVLRTFLYRTYAPPARPCQALQPLPTLAPPSDSTLRATHACGIHAAKPSRTQAVTATWVCACRALWAHALIAVATPDIVYARFAES
ncbi:hypothetical protein BDY21DRAFT_58512 [Lineolata rhizophorae]|uniref:Uncharacterized protein n=1 Tax=Lineolata rhizophorae TaxID=578093 RepID=A0A6A6NXH4_9PEZI|nr:hypothetical protein BDY21DRAFT_58512 [Lineolata rhizophorae]